MRLFSLSCFLCSKKVGVRKEVEEYASFLSASVSGKELEPGPSLRRSWSVSFPTKYTYNKKLSLYLVFPLYHGRSYRISVMEEVRLRFQDGAEDS